MSTPRFVQTSYVSEYLFGDGSIRVLHVFKTNDLFCLGCEDLACVYKTSLASFLHL
jgi:hypothetical protein